MRIKSARYGPLHYFYFDLYCILGFSSPLALCPLSLHLCVSLSLCLSLFPLTIRAALVPRRDSLRTLMEIRPLPSPTVPFLPRRRPCRRRCPRKMQPLMSLTLRATPRTIPRLHRYLRFNVASIRCASFLRTLAEEFAILPKHVSVVPLDYCCSRISRLSNV